MAFLCRNQPSAEFKIFTASISLTFGEVLLAMILLSPANISASCGGVCSTAIIVLNQVNIDFFLSKAFGVRRLK